jgi:hypothetical protein
LQVLFHENTGALYKFYPAKGYLLISSVDHQTDGWCRFRQKRERERDVSFASATVFDHQTTYNQHQTVEKGNANTSTLYRKATSVQGRDAAWEDGGAIAGSWKLLELAIQSTSVQKKSMGRERRRWRAHQNEEEGLQSTRKPRRRTTATP